MIDKLETIDDAVQGYCCQAGQDVRGLVELDGHEAHEQTFHQELDRDEQRKLVSMQMHHKYQYQDDANQNYSKKVVNC